MPEEALTGTYWDCAQSILLKTLQWNQDLTKTLICGGVSRFVQSNTHVPATKSAAGAPAGTRKHHPRGGKRATRGGLLSVLGPATRSTHTLIRQTAAVRRRRRLLAGLDEGTVPAAAQTCARRMHAGIGPNQTSSQGRGSETSCHFREKARISKA